MLVQSADSSLQTTAEQCGARFASKSAPSLLHEIREFMHNDMRFGPLTFKDGTSGSTLGKVATPYPSPCPSPLPSALAYPNLLALCQPPPPNPIPNPNPSPNPSPRSPT